jgi:hypothetical protein
MKFIDFFVISFVSVIFLQGGISNSSEDRLTIFIGILSLTCFLQFVFEESEKISRPTVFGLIFCSTEFVVRLCLHPDLNNIWTQILGLGISFLAAVFIGKPLYDKLHRS